MAGRMRQPHAPAASAADEVSPQPSNARSRGSSAVDQHLLGDRGEIEIPAVRFLDQSESQVEEADLGVVLVHDVRKLCVDRDSSGPGSCAGFSGREQLAVEAEIP